MTRNAKYFPVLKWRMGEYQALTRLDADVRARVVPLLEVCPPEFDFETRRMKKTLDQQLAPFAKRLKQKWGNSPAYLDTRLLESAARMADGSHPLEYLLKSVELDQASLSPVTGLDRDKAHQDVVRAYVSVDGRRVGVRLSLEDCLDEPRSGAISSLVARLACSPSAIRFFIDLRAPNFDPIDEFASLVVDAITGCPPIATAAELTLLATSFPESMSAFKRGISVLERREWALYKKVINLSAAKGFWISFGDYAVGSNDPIQIDMRMVKPAASVRYATDNHWIVAKGSNVRDNGYGQYVGLCADVVKSGSYLGDAYSYGSEYVLLCANGQASTGTLTTWRAVGTNHHITKLVRDVANLPVT